MFQNHQKNIQAKFGRLHNRRIILEGWAKSAGITDCRPCLKQLAGKAYNGMSKRFSNVY
jgi:hypothetical protein